MMHALVIALACIGGLVVAELVLACAIVAWSFVDEYRYRRQVRRQAAEDREFRRLIAQLSDTIPYDQETD